MHAVRVIWVALYCAMHSVRAVRVIWSALQCIAVYSEGDMGWIILCNAQCAGSEGDMECITVHYSAQCG